MNLEAVSDGQARTSRRTACVVVRMKGSLIGGGPFKEVLKGIDSHYVSVVRAIRAASTIATKADRTSSQRRVFKPQSGFTQSCLADKTFVAFLTRSSISCVVGMRGEWMS